MDLGALHLAGAEKPIFVISTVGCSRPLRPCSHQEGAAGRSRGCTCAQPRLHALVQVGVDHGSGCPDADCLGALRCCTVSERMSSKRADSARTPSGPHYTPFQAMAAARQVSGHKLRPHIPARPQESPSTTIPDTETRSRRTRPCCRLTSIRLLPSHEPAAERGGHSWMAPADVIAICMRMVIGTRLRCRATRHLEDVASQPKPAGPFQMPARWHTSTQRRLAPRHGPRHSLRGRLRSVCCRYTPEPRGLILGNPPWRDWPSC